MMRYILVALAALLVFGGVATKAQARPAEWKHYGADRSYATKELAIADAYNVFKRAGWPEKAAREMQKVMRTEAPTARIELKKGDRLDFMRTGPSGLWRNVLVSFEPTVTAPSSMWRRTIDGVTYEAILPDDCRNLAGRRTHVPVPQQPCVWLLVPGLPGSKLSVQISQPYVDTSDCPATIAGAGTGRDGRTFNPNGYKPITQDAAHPCDWTEVNAYFKTVGAIEGCVNLSNGWYAIKVNRSVLTNPDIIVVLCLTSADKKTTLSVDVHPEDYVAAGNGVYIATVWSSEEVIPANYKGKTFLWWEWDHRRAAELMQLSDRR